MNEEKKEYLDANDIKSHFLGMVGGPPESVQNYAMFDGYVNDGFTKVICHVKREGDREILTPVFVAVDPHMKVRDEFHNRFDNPPEQAN